MIHPKVILTAGHLHSQPTEVLAELLIRSEVTVAGIIVVSVLNPKRILALIRQHGIDAAFHRFRSSVDPTAKKNTRQTDPSSESHTPMAALLYRHHIRIQGLRTWCKNAGVPLKIVKDLNSEATIDVVRTWSADAAIYTGGGILRSNFIDAAKKVLNAHAGPLPEIRGMNAAEWSALLKIRPEITVHFIDQGIDTGAPIATFAYKRLNFSTVDALREAAVVAGIEGLHRVVIDRMFECTPQISPSAPTHRQCFIMAPALMDILRQRLYAAHVKSTASP